MSAPTKHASTFTDRDRFRDVLKTVLQAADDERFVNLLWAVNALQSGHESAAQAYLRNFPPEAATSDMKSPWAIYKWEIEDLSNELFSIPKRQPKRNQRPFDYSDFGLFLKVNGTFRAMQNAEDGVDIIAHPVLTDMRRIVAKQFDWQRGYLNQAQFYRSYYVYGQGECANYFKSAHGIDINAFSLIGFGVFSFLADRPFMASDIDWSELGLTPSDAIAAFTLLSAPSSTARNLATDIRREPGHSGYKPSFLRRYPCIVFDGKRIRSPLPQLILERITAGLFFDVVEGGGKIRADYGQRFESYCVELLSRMIVGLSFEGEFRYGSRKVNYNSPDALCSDDGVVEIAFECKATRMSFAARYSRDPLAERGFDDLSKGVLQIWRFFSHCRRGIIPRKIAPDAVGCVLTLESWMVMAQHLYEGVLDRAREQARGDPEIQAEDCRPIEFCPITDMETVLQRATPKSFLKAMKEAARPENYGWMFTSIHDRFVSDDSPENPFPFSDRLGELLPWWKKVEDENEQ